MKCIHGITGLILTLLILNSCDWYNNEVPDESYELYITQGSDAPASISPDGKFIVFNHTGFNPEYPNGLYLIDINGEHRRLLKAGEYLHATWTPDSKFIVSPYHGRLEKMDLEGNLIDYLEYKVGLFLPDFSPDGEKLLFGSSATKDGGVFISNKDFENVRRVFSFEDKDYTSYGAVWVSDSTLICTSTSKNWNGYEIFLRDTSFNSEKRLTNNKKVSKSDLDFCHLTNQIVYRENGKIVIMNLDGTNRKVITLGSDPDISPDGKTIVYTFSSPDRKRGVLYSIDVNGKNKKQLTF